MLRIHRNLNKNDNVVYELDCSTVLQVERWLDINNVIAENKEKGFLFQGLAYDSDSSIEQLLSFKTVIDSDKEVYAVWFDLSNSCEYNANAGGGTSMRERDSSMEPRPDQHQVWAKKTNQYCKPRRFRLFSVAPTVIEPDPDLPIIDVEDIELTP